MRKILKKLRNDTKGGLLSSDIGREFNNEGFQKLLEAHDLAHKTKGNGEPNALAALDRAMQTVRKDISSRMREEPDKTWSQVINSAIVAYNRSIHGTMRDAPADIEDSVVLQYLQVSDNAKKYAHNKKLPKKKLAKAEEMDAFRRPKKAKAFGRGFKAKFGDKEELDKVQDGTLV